LIRVLDGGAAVIAKAEEANNEGTRRFHVAISRATGALDIAQTLSTYGPGAAPSRRNPAAEEVLYVLSGEGICSIDGYRYDLQAGTAAYIPPGSVFQVETAEGCLTTVSVCCPQEDSVEVGVSMPRLDSARTKPFRTVNERQRQSIQTGDRYFKVLVNEVLGAQRVTQFLGTIPPSRAPMHHHTYEEAIYIIEGEGIVWTRESSAEFRAGSSIYLPRGVSHCLENNGFADVKLLGVFHPLGSPAVAYDD